MIKKRQYKWFSMGVLFGIVFLLAGCAEVKNNNEGSLNEDMDKKATLAFPWSPASLDPHGGNSWEVMRAGTAETLVKINEELEPTPWLAKEWKQENESTWIFELESNVSFHNGKRMDAASVKESLLRSLQKNQRAKDLLQVESIEVLGPNELKIVTKQPNAALIAHLADPSTIIVDVNSIEGKDNYPALTGPFTFKEFNKDEALVVQRYEDYWGKQALLSEITIKFISDGNTRLMALQSGDVDAATDIPIDSIPLLEKDKEIDTLTAPSLRTHMLMFNIQSPLFKELANRKVIDMSIPREAIVRSVMNEQGAEANSPFPAILPFGKVGEMKETQTVDQLIKQEGWKKNKDGILEKQGKPFEVKLLTFPQRPELTIMAETIQNELLKLGIKVSIRQVENIDDALANDSWDISMYSMLTAHTGDPQYFLNIFYQSNSESNVSHYVSSSLERLIDQLNQTTDSTIRNQLAIQIQEIIKRDLPQSFIVHPKTVFGVRNGVKGFSPNPIEYYYIHSQIDINE